MDRAEFSQLTKDLVAARACFRCSFPNCDKATIGPGATADQTASIGVASHIFAASGGGPRGSGGLTEEELKNPDNGIWLCNNHSRLVDTNRGTKYPPELLLSYKSLHESRISREMQGLSSPLGWFHELRILNSPIFAPETSLKLAKLNLVIGNNDTGKSALCEWLGGFSESRHLSRWRSSRRRGPQIDVFLKLFQPEEKIIELNIEKNGKILFRDDGTEVPLNACPMKIIYPRSRAFQNTRGLNDLQILASIFDMDESYILTLCEEVHRYEYSTVKNINFKEDEDGVLRLHADVSGTVPGLPFAALSGREQERILIEVACAAARTFAKYVPTLLIFDGSVTILFDGWFEFYANHFKDAKSLFQTVVVIPTRTIDTDKLTWLGWEIIRTIGTVPKVTIEQNIRAIE